MAILIVTCLLLAWFLSPQPGQRIPRHSIGAIAAKDIKANRDFLVEDKAATEQKLLEASREAPSVYEYHSDLPFSITAAVEETFFAVRNIYEASTEEDAISKRGSIIEAAQNLLKTKLGVSLSENDLVPFYDHEFSLHVTHTVTHLILETYRERFVGDDWSSYTQDSAILVYDTAYSNELMAVHASEIFTLENTLSLMRTKASDLLANEPPALAKASLLLAEKLLRPNLIYSKSASEQRKKQILEDVKPVFYKVLKNEMIVREGQKVSVDDLEKLRVLNAQQGGHPFNRVSVMAGTFLLIAILALILYRISIHHMRTVPETTKNLLFMALVAVLQIALVKAGVFVSESAGTSFSSLDNPFIYVIPFASGAMLVSVLLGSRDMGLVFSIFVSFLVTFLFQDNAAMFLYSFSGSIAASYFIVHCKKRSDFFKTGLLIGAVNLFVVVAVTLFTGNILVIDTAIKLLMSLLGGLLAGIVVSGTVPLFEYFFGYTTDIKLLELANLNQPIFQEMIITSPGTYHHSIVVASMVEAAAEEIGANSLLAKVGAYYHDIGKMKKSHYYVENQQNWENKHDKLKPSMSSRVIISHVKDGCEMAESLKVGDEIRNIIRQHHGTRLAVFFYEKAKKEHDPSQPPILESDFRYPGPKPQSKEAALVLLADIVEASSRILKNPTPSRIKALIDTRIREAVDDNQLDESNLTFSDLNKIAECFVRILNGIFHHRIEYIDSTGKEMSHVQKNGSSRKKPTGTGPPRSRGNRTVTSPNTGNSRL